MEAKPLFSVIVLSYNQKAYYKEALQSVFNQSYPYIELILADDASSDGIEKEAERFINSNKPDNIVSVKTVFHKENVGTTRNVNDAIKRAQGRYILFFAADDALYDEHVLDKFCESFERHPQADLISGQCLMMDTELKKRKEYFLDEDKVKTFNEQNSHGQFEMMARECFLAMGATAFRSSTLEEYGWFDEQYRVVEDWSWMLRVLRKGAKAFCEAFNALLHRDGGISHASEASKLSESAKIYRLDIYNIYINEVLPFLKKLDVESKLEIYNRFNMAKAYLIRFEIPFKWYSFFYFDPVFSMNLFRWRIMRDRKILPNLLKLFAYSYITYFVLLFIIDFLPQMTIGVSAISNALTSSLIWIECILQLEMILVGIGIVGIAMLHILSIIKKYLVKRKNG